MSSRRDKTARILQWALCTLTRIPARCARSASAKKMMLDFRWTPCVRSWRAAGKPGQTVVDVKGNYSSGGQQRRERCVPAARPAQDG